MVYIARFFIPLAIVTKRTCLNNARFGIFTIHTLVAFRLDCFCSCQAFSVQKFQIIGFAGFLRPCLDGLHVVPRHSFTPATPSRRLGCLTTFLGNQSRVTASGKTMLTNRYRAGQRYHNSVGARYGLKWLYPPKVTQTRWKIDV